MMPWGRGFGHDRLIDLHLTALTALRHVSGRNFLYRHADLPPGVGVAMTLTDPWLEACFDDDPYWFNGWHAMSADTALTALCYDATSCVTTYELDGSLEYPLWQVRHMQAFNFHNISNIFTLQLLGYAQCGKPEEPLSFDVGSLHGLQHLEIGADNIYMTITAALPLRVLSLRAEEELSVHISRADVQAVAHSLEALYASFAGSPQLPPLYGLVAQLHASGMSCVRTVSQACPPAPKRTELRCLAASTTGIGCDWRPFACQCRCCSECLASAGGAVPCRLLT